MVNADGQLVPRQVTEHDDHVGARPVGDDRHSDGNTDEDRSPARRVIGEIGKEGSDRYRSDEITNTTARLDHRPTASGNHEAQAFGVHGYAGEPQAEDSDLRRPVHQLGHCEVAKGNGKEQEEQWKGERSRNLPAEHRRHRQNHHEGQGELRDYIGSREFAEKPGAAGTGKQGDRQIAVSGRQDGDAGTFPPDQPQGNRRDNEAVRIGVRTQPDSGHRQDGFTTKHQDQYQGAYQGRQSHSPPRMRGRRCRSRC